MRAAVLGSPISHSLSPLLHNTAYSILGITGEYSAIDVPSANFADFLSHAPGALRQRLGQIRLRRG